MDQQIQRYIDLSVYARDLDERPNTIETKEKVNAQLIELERTLPQQVIVDVSAYVIGELSYEMLEKKYDV